MRALFRLALAGALLATAMLGTVASVSAGDTITVTCSNGFERTVAAKSARGVAKSLNKFNSYTESGVTCTAGPGAPRLAAIATKLTITCTNGLVKTVDARAVGGITRALDAFNTRSQTGVTCSAA